MFDNLLGQHKQRSRKRFNDLLMHFSCCNQNLCVTCHRINLSSQSRHFIHQRSVDISKQIMRPCTGLKTFRQRTTEFLHIFFAKSSIHCFPYVARRDFHLVERIIWLGVIVFSSCCAQLVFSGQWQRFNENPTVLSIEILSQGEFERPSFTICTNYTDLLKAKEIVES